ncbi:MAG: hypothetical protein PVI23_14305 [Maricaulaceae bacterium]|jgi:protein ImuB
MSLATSGQPAEPFALIHSTTGGFRLYAVNAAAERAGLWPGQALADARAVEPGLVAAAADPDGDAEALKRLARWCERWTPWIRPETDDSGGSDGLALDLTGCTHLYESEEALAADMAVRFKALGLDAQIAIAPSLGLAWGAARFDRQVAQTGWRVVAANEVEATLDALQVKALRLPPQTVDNLVSLGLKRVGDVRRQPLTGLVRRFGAQIATRLAQAEGKQDKPVAPIAPETPLRAQARLVEPIVLADHVKEAGRRAVTDLCAILTRTGQGARTLVLYLYRVDGARFAIRAGTAAPSRDPVHLMKLLGEKIDRAEIDLGFGVDLVEAVAAHAEPYGETSGSLVAEGPGFGVALDQLVDSLAARLGAEAISRAHFSDSHIPERASGWSPAAEGETATAPADAAPRPLLMLDRPEEVDALAETPDGPPRLFRWRRTTHRVARAEGPERIAPEWWREREMDAPTRDYFRVETDAGRRFWLYRAGLYQRETAAPKWFVHGAGA